MPSEQFSPRRRGDTPPTDNLPDSPVYSEPFEVTREDYLHSAGQPTNSRSTVGQRISNLLHRKPRASRSLHQLNYHHQSLVPTASDNGTVFSAEGVQSVANFTVASHETVKVSNMTDKPDEDPSKKGKRWNKLKRMMGGTKNKASENASTETAQRKHSLSEDNPQQQQQQQQAHQGASRVGLTVFRKRFNTYDSTIPRSRSSPTTLTQQERTDHLIRGRFDGLDVLSLGGIEAFPPPPNSLYSGNLMQSSFDFPTFSFTGQDKTYSPAQMVSTMLWSSAGKQYPEIILEGFLPGGDDRWTVRIELEHQTVSEMVGRNSSEPPPLQRVETDDGEASEDGSPLLTTQKLWNSLWGNDPVPAKSTDVPQLEADEDPLLHLAAECSIPIDIDEDTFIISSREHVNSIHEIVASPLAAGRFDSAIKIFEKLAKGIDLQEDEQVKFFRGSTMRNIGMVRLWQGEYDKALSSFEKAVEIRSRYLPKNHPDIAVSLVRKAFALFALNRFEEAEASLDVALSMFPKDHISRSKILNNLGVIYYQQRNTIGALKDFTGSLEIQRLSLEGPIRRETTVYDASITLGNMGKLYLERNDFELAYFVYEEALLLQTTIFRKDHDLVLSSLTCLAAAKAKSGEVRKALQILQGCLRSQNARFGTNSRQSLETIGIMGFMYAYLEEFDDALKCMVTVRKYQKANLPRNHPALRKTKEMIEKLEKSLGKDFSMWI